MDSSKSRVKSKPSRQEVETIGPKVSSSAMEHELLANTGPSKLCDVSPGFAAETKLVVDARYWRRAMAAVAAGTATDTAGN